MSASRASASRTVTETVAVTFLTPSVGWRASDQWNPNSGNLGPLSISRTRDGGLDWHTISVAGGAVRGSGQSFSDSISHIVFADQHDGWLYGARLYATHDGGHTWRRLPLLGSQTGLAVSGRSIWRLDSSCNMRTHRCHLNLLTSTAGSNTWHLMPWHPPNTLTLGSALARAGLRHGWFVSGPYMVHNHMTLHLLATGDGGHTWHALPMPCSTDWGSIGGQSAQLVAETATSLWLFCASQPSAGEQEKSIFRSSDGGRRWRMVADSGLLGNAHPSRHNLTIAGYFDNAAVTSPLDAWVALGRGTLVGTEDGGRTWHAAIPYAVANAGDGGVGPVQFVDARHGWLLSFPHLLFRTTDAGRHWREIDLQ